MDSEYGSFGQNILVCFLFKDNGNILDVWVIRLRCLIMKKLPYSMALLHLIGDAGILIYVITKIPFQISKRKYKEIVVGVRTRLICSSLNGKKIEIGTGESVCAVSESFFLVLFSFYLFQKPLKTTWTSGPPVFSQSLLVSTLMAEFSRIGTL